MRSLRMKRWARLLVPGGVVVQITACFGPDPEFYITNLAASTVVSEVIRLLFNLFTSGLAAAAGG